MKIIITEIQINKLQTHIQSLIDSELDNMREESLNWGLGEMDEYEEISSINRIEVDRISTYVGIKVYVNFYVNNEDREEFDNVRSEIQYRVSEWIPNVKLFINNIIR